MGANFTPSWNSYKDLKPFRFWCQKVLPSVYNDSLSYYDLLTKITDTLNSVIENMEGVEENTDALLEAYEELQEYVNTYFDETLPTLVENRLDEMVEDGTLETLVKPYFDPWIEDAEAWAIGRKNNVPVSESEPQYENNAKYYAEQADSSAETAATLVDNVEDIQDEVRQAISTQNSAIDVLEGRMDTFTNLPNASTAGDAELQDIRVAANGFVYPTAGDAVRGQIVNTENYLLERTDNLYDSNTAIPGIINSSGEILATEPYLVYRTSQFISVQGLSNITLLYVKPFALAFYDSSKNFIERLTGSNVPLGTYSTTRGQDSAEYIRITYTLATYEDGMIAAGSDSDIPYAPYMQFKAPNYVFTDENISTKCETYNIFNGENIIDKCNTYNIFNAANFDPVFFPAKVRQAAWRGNTRNAGGTAIAPENSWTAYKNAIDNAFDMLWVAVIQYSSDGTFYCSHDNTLTINGVTDDFYNFDDTQIQSVTLSDGSKIPELEDVIKYCALNGMPIGLRLGRLPSSYQHTLISNSGLYRDDVWDSFIELIKRYNITLTIFSGADAQCSILHSLEPMAHIQTTSHMSDTTENLLQLIDTTKAIGARRCSVNVYITNLSANIILTNDVMEKARENNVRVFAVTSEPVASAAELAVIKNLCPDFVITHSKLDFSEIPS